MRDIISCFSENAINVSSHSPCSSYPNNTCIISPNSITTPSTQNASTSVYKITLSTQKQHLITVSWCKTQTGQTLTINFGEEEDPSTSFKFSMNSRLFKKKKGSKTIESNNSKIELIWDLSTAKFNTGSVEPLDGSGYSVLITVDSEIALVLGDGSEYEEVVLTKKMANASAAPSMAKSCLISRKEYFSGNTLYSTRAQFRENGDFHDILIKCSGEKEGSRNHYNYNYNHPVLSVCIDKKTVIKVKRLQWNFRGNQTIFIDGLLVDLMWDLYDWFFNGVSGYAVFMFRTRSGMDSRLWLEEKMVKKEQEKLEFSLLIYGGKNS